jgi:phenylacetaldehyde dehydrogenase
MLKPSEDILRTAIRMLQLIQEPGLPDGVINLVTGYGNEAGASIICGGDTAGPNACCVLPRVVAGVRPGSHIVREEIFGPVVVVTPFDDVGKLVDAANDSPYGLAAGIWSEGLSNATRLANRIKAGKVWINSHAMYDASLPIGGMKQSGFGRDSGQAALENYLELKTVCAVV